MVVFFSVDILLKFGFLQVIVFNPTHPLLVADPGLGVGHGTVCDWRLWVRHYNYRRVVVNSAMQRGAHQLHGHVPCRLAVLELGGVERALG